MLKYILSLALVSFFVFAVPALAEESLEQQLTAAQAELDAANKEGEAYAKEYEVLSAKNTEEIQAIATKYADAANMKPEELAELNKVQAEMAAKTTAVAQEFAVKNAQHAAKVMALTAKVMELTQKIQAEKAKAAQ